MKSKEELVDLFVSKPASLIYSRNNLDFFANILRKKCHRSWLLRESSIPGMITVSYMDDKKGVIHNRYMFDGKRWTSPEIDNNNLEAQLETIHYTPTYKNNIETHWLALRLIILSRFEMDKIILPGMGLESNRYLHFNPSSKNYNHPIKALKKLNEWLSEQIVSIDTLDIEKVNFYANCDLFYDADEMVETLICFFEQFGLSTEELYNLKCPIADTVYETPILLNTGIFLDYKSYQPQSPQGINLKPLTVCPLTQLPITKFTHLPHYSSCIAIFKNKFIDLMNLAKTKSNDVSSKACLN